MIPDVERHKIQSRAQWLSMRKLDVTASDIAAVCGVSPYSSALQVWADKTGQLVTEENNAMRRGRWLENGVIAAVKEEHPDWMIVQPGHYLRSPSLRIGATPDAVVTVGPARAILQCKVVSRPVFEEQWQGGPPLYYLLQTLTEMNLEGTATGYLAALVIDTFTADLEIFPVGQNAPAWMRICDAVAAFWKIVDAGGKPAANYGVDGEAIAKLYRAVKDSPPVDMTNDNRLAELCFEFNHRGSLMRALDGERDALKAEIVEKLGGASKAKAQGFKIANTPILAEVKAHTREYDRLTVTKDKVV